MPEPMRSETMSSPTAESISSIVERVLGGDAARHLSAAQRAHAAWFAANGDRERQHTTKVFLRPPRAKGMAPIICVYVDSHAYLTDLTANRDLYLARLANQGFAVSGIEFAVDREARAKRVEARRAAKAAERHVVVEELTQTMLDVEFAPDDAARVRELVDELPEGLKQSVSKAIANSIMNKGR